MIAALKKHEIGYHSDTHSQQPTIAVYLQHTGWEDGAAEFYRREAQGARDIERIFGVTAECVTASPARRGLRRPIPALKRMGIGMYLDEGSHVGIDDQPFYYGGMLNVFKMRSNVARMDLKGGTAWPKAKRSFRRPTINCARRAEVRSASTITLRMGSHGVLGRGQFPPRG